MSSTKNSDDWIGIMLVGTLVYIITLFSAYSIAVTYIQHSYMPILCSILPLQVGNPGWSASQTTVKQS